MGALKEPPNVEMKKGGAKKPPYKRQVEELLRSYPTYRHWMNEKLKYEFPSGITSYEEGHGGRSEYQSSTERYGIKRAEIYNRTKEVQQVDSALRILNRDEKKIIEAYYFLSDEWPGVEVFIEKEKMCMGKTTYHKVKKGALEKLAFILGFK